MESVDVIALVSNPSMMNPYVTFDDNQNFELMHIDDSLYGTLSLFLFDVHTYDVALKQIAGQTLLFSDSINFRRYKYRNRGHSEV